MTTLAIHFSDRAHQVIDNVTAYFYFGNHLHIRTLFGNCPEERMYARKNIIAIFEVEDDGSKRRFI